MKYYQEKGLRQDKLMLGILITMGLFGVYKNSLYGFSWHVLLLIFSNYFLGLFWDIYILKKNNYNSLKGLLISLALSYQTPLIVSSLIFLIYLFFQKKLPKEFNYPLLIITILSLIFPNYANQMEQKVLLFYKTTDIFLGINIGGVGITSILLMLIGYVLLSLKFYYKKEIPFATLLTYIILVIGEDALLSNSNLIKDIMNPSVFYLAIFILPINICSPLKKQYQILYGILGGLLMMIFRHLNFLNGPFLGALMVNIGWWIGKLLSKKAK